MTPLIFILAAGVAMTCPLPYADLGFLDENGILAHAIVDCYAGTITLHDDSIVKNLRTSYCLVIEPNAKPKVINSTFGRNCEPTS